MLWGGNCFYINKSKLLNVIKTHIVSTDTEPEYGFSHPEASISLRRKEQ